MHITHSGMEMIMRLDLSSLKCGAAELLASLINSSAVRGYNH